MLKNQEILALLCHILSKKITDMVHLEANSNSVKKQVLLYMKKRCEDGMLRGLEKTAFYLNCSPRHLQRIMNELMEEGAVEKLGKGKYKRENIKGKI